MKKRKVLVAERVSPEGLAVLEKEADVDIRLGMTREELLETVPGYEAILIRSETGVDEEFLEKASSLKVVGRAGNGIDNIKLPAATEKGVIVANTPDSNTTSAAELACGLIMAVCRNIPQADAYLKSGEWDRNRFKGTELYGKTLGVVGLGRIGSMVASRMAAFKMKVIAYDPYISDSRFERVGTEKKETLEELLQESDIITIHTPKTAETLNMIAAEQFAIMKPGARIVNDARGGIINEQDLLEALKTGRIAGAAIDTHVNEPSFNDPLFELDNVVVTPHLGASTDEAQANVGITIANQVLSALKGEIVPNAVNLPTLNREDLKEQKPYIDTVEKIGRIYYQLFSDPVETVKIRYYGNIAKQDTGMLTLAFLKGLLEPVAKDQVNYVNAKLFAEQKGINTVEEKDTETSKGFTSLISVEFRNSRGAITVSGALSAKREGRIVEINGYEVDMAPEGYVLFIQNIDVPGVVGRIGTMLGSENVNIATMQVGRNRPGDTALMMLGVDADISRETLEKIKAIENVTLAKIVKF